MNVWRWVTALKKQLREKGNNRLADLIEQIPSAAVDERHDQFDQLYPEFLAMVKAENNPWLEVFARHWYLHSHVLSRDNVKEKLPEAIALFEFSSEESTRDCPQSICAVQDLTACYASVDGPGYVDERIAVSTETLAKITPAWNCYKCISAEKISAIEDTGDFEQALQALKHTREAIASSGDKTDDKPFELMESSIYLELGDYEKAEVIAKAAENPYAGESFILGKRQQIALILARQGKFDEAQEYECRYSEIHDKPGKFSDWCEINFLKAQHDETLNNADLNYCFNVMIERFIRQGILRRTLRLIEFQATLAAKRNDVFTLDIALARFNTIVKQLVKDLGASDRLAQLTNLRDTTVQSMAITPDEETLVEQIKSDGEMPDLGTLHLAYKQFSDNAYIFQAYYDALRANGYDAQAQPLIEDWLKHDVNRPHLLQRYGFLLLDQNHNDTFDAFFTPEFIDTLSDESKKYCYWLCSYRYETENPAASFAFVEQILAITPDAHNSLQRAAQLAQTLEHYDKAIEYWRRYIDVDPENLKEYYWDMMIPATLSEQWDLVRQCCAILDIELDSTEGPVRQNMGSCRIELTLDSGEKVNMAAQRTGPVEAEISGVRSIDEQQFFGDRVVFYPGPLNKLDQEDDEGYMHDADGYYNHLYTSIKTIETNPHFVFDVDGVHPGEDGFAALEDVMERHGVLWSVRSNEEYELYREGDESALPGLYFYILCPPEADLSLLNKDLFACIANFDHPLIWPRLSEKLGDKEALVRHQAIEEQYNL